MSDKKPCQNCGKENYSDQSFCSYCNFPVEEYEGLMSGKVAVPYDPSDPYYNPRQILEEMMRKRDELNEGGLFWNFRRGLVWNELKQKLDEDIAEYERTVATLHAQRLLDDYKKERELDEIQLDNFRAAKQIETLIKAQDALNRANNQQFEDNLLFGVRVRARAYEMYADVFEGEELDAFVNSAVAAYFEGLDSSPLNIEALVDKTAQIFKQLPRGDDYS